MTISVFTGFCSNFPVIVRFWFTFYMIHRCDRNVTYAVELKNIKFENLCLHIHWSFISSKIGGSYFIEYNLV